MLGAGSWTRSDLCEAVRLRHYPMRILIGNGGFDEGADQVAREPREPAVPSNERCRHDHWVYHHDHYFWLPPSSLDIPPSFVPGVSNPFPWCVNFNLKDFWFMRAAGLKAVAMAVGKIFILQLDGFSNGLIFITATFGHQLCPRPWENWTFLIGKSIMIVHPAFVVLPLMIQASWT